MIPKRPETPLLLKMRDQHEGLLRKEVSILFDYIRVLENRCSLGEPSDKN